jgi:hypothetical protein
MEYTNIMDYINLTRDERRKHLKLDEDCIEIGGNSTSFVGLLAHFLKTTIPFKTKNKILLCHACHNGNCSNPNHLYFGTRKDNTQDAIENGTHVNFWTNLVKKYGLEEAKRKMARSSEHASKAGKGNKGNPKSAEHRRKISESLKKRKRI